MDIFLTLLVVALALIGFVTEWLPVDFTAVATMVGLIVLNLVSPEEGISGFSNSATVTVMAMFILSAGIAKTGAIRSVTNLLSRWGGEHPSRQILTMGLLVGPITALVNNSAVVPMFVPIVENWSVRLKVSVSKLLIPLSYASILGGTITVLGTSTNVLASGLSEQLGYGPFSFFMFTRMGLITFLIGLAYLSLVAPRLLPDRRPPLQALGGTEKNQVRYVSEIKICPESSIVGQAVHTCGLQAKYGLEILRLVRQSPVALSSSVAGALPQPSLSVSASAAAFEASAVEAHSFDHKVLQQGDILIVKGELDQLLQVHQERGLELLPHAKFDQPLPSPVPESSPGGDVGQLAEVLVLDNTSLVGSTLRDMKFRERYNATVLAIRRGRENISQRLDHLQLKIGDILLVSATLEHLGQLQSENNLMVLQQRDLVMPRADKAWVAIGIGALVVLLAALNVMPIMVSALVGAVMMVVTGCLEPGEIYTAIRWNIIFLLASLIPLGIAMNNSGTTQLIADTMAQVAVHLPGYWVLLMFYVTTALLTEVLSNSASVVLMLPVAVRAAEALGFNPVAFMLVVTFAASASFMTPVGYQTNTMVYGAGGYKFTDFTRVGAPLSMLLSILTPFFIIHFYGL